MFLARLAVALAALVFYLSAASGADSWGPAASTPGLLGTNPTSTLTRPANTAAYSAGDLVASSTTAGSIVVPSFPVLNYDGSAIISRIRLSTNATTGWGTNVTVNLWKSAPTYTYGDNGPYTVATGGSAHLATYACALTQYADAAAGECEIDVGSFLTVSFERGQTIYWDLTATDGATPISGQTFTITAEMLN